MKDLRKSQRHSQTLPGRKSLSNGRKNTKNAFNTLKEKLTNAPILKCADPSLPYEITSDASDTGVGAVLSQKDDKGNRPIAYTSRKLSPTEKDYSTPEKEATWNNNMPYKHGGLTFMGLNS